MPKPSSPGWIRVPLFTMYVPASHLAGTSQIVYALSHTPGFRCVVEKVTFVQDIALVGVGGSQTINVRKGAADGTTLCSLNLLVAAAGIGTVSSASVTAANDDIAYLDDNDTMSIEMAASGTAFSAGEGTLTVWGRMQPQAAR